MNAHNGFFLSLGDKVLREVVEELSVIEVSKKLKSLYLKRYSSNKLFLKKQLDTSNGRFKGCKKTYA